MAYEIYYTSAQQGIKHSAQGFCTVAATEGIPPTLLQRLESLSGYRHHFGPGDITGGKNPVTHAHWTLSLSGKTYYVLSRISDAGFDYTHRTNSLAHHIALEASELPPAGPAWLLAQANVMIERWNGQVGPIARPVPLPYQDAAPAVCSHWQRLTGDAGWGGVLADAFSKSVGKPVCILFAPGQDILPLIEESIRLLPPAQRWHATFNTYFTSMPTSVVCAWRCCLAGTPAALAAARYASSGVIINLADPGSMGNAPDSAWTTAARTGISVASKVTMRPEISKPIGVVPPVLAGPALELAPEKPRPLDELAAASRHSAKTPPRPPMFGMPGILATAAAQPTDIDQQAQRHRRQMLLLFAAAVLAVGFGIVMVIWVANRPVEIVTPVVPRPLPEVPPTTEPQTKPIVEPPPPTVTIEPKTQPIAVPHPIPATHPDIPPVVIKHPPPPVIPPEPVIVLHSASGHATGGSGLSDAMQTIDLLPADEVRLHRVHALNVLFPNERTNFSFKHGELDGTLFTKPAHGTPGVAVLWKDEGKPKSITEILHISLNTSHTQIAVRWKSSLMLSRPDVGSLAYWLVQNSHLLASEPGVSNPHRLTFLEPELPTINPQEPVTTLHLPGDFPPDCILTAKAGQMPAGWQVTSTPDNNSNLQSLMLVKHTKVPVLDAVFHLNLRSGWTALESDLAEQTTRSVNSLEKFQKDLTDINIQIQHLTDDATHDLADLDKQLAEKTLLQSKTDLEIAEKNFTRTGLKNFIDDLNNQIQARRAKLESDKAPLLPKQHDFDQLCQGFREANTAYADLKAFDLSVTLPDGTAIATLHFVHK